jgi:hypothetical protein
MKKQSLKIGYFQISGLEVEALAYIQKSFTSYFPNFSRFFDFSCLGLSLVLA